MMPFKYFLVVPSLLIPLLSPSEVNATSHNAGHGRVSMQGAIIDTACAIDIGDQEQSIDMSTESVGEFIREGHGHSRPFAIHLVDCSLVRATPGLPDWQHFQVTFDGDHEESGLFSVGGGVQGVALQIVDPQGHQAIPGSPMPAGDLEPGSMTLNYTLNLVGNRHPLQAGEERSTVRFKLDYY